MQLDKATLELMHSLERRFGLDSYTLIPRLIREEIHSLVIRPEAVHNMNGELLEVKLVLDLYENEKKKENEKAA